MSKELETEKIFLDTSVFISENFFAGTKLKALIKHSEEQEIELFTTEVTIQESLSNLESRFRQAKNLLNKHIKDLSSKAKILKNLESINQIFKIQESFDPGFELDDLKEKFRELMANHFKLIEIDEKNTHKIIYDYFVEKPPFKAGNKKYEFPDAFVLNSLESWCKKENEKIYVLSDDEDIISFKSKRLIPFKEYDKLLNLISYTYSEENIIKKVEETFENFEKEILERIKDEFEYGFPSNGWDSNYGFEYFLNSFNYIKIYYLDHSILSVYDNKASLEMALEVQYSAEVGYDDLCSAYYDKEDGIHYGVEKLSQTVTDRLEITAELDIYVNLPGKPAVWEWGLQGITGGIPEYIGLE